MFAGIDTHKDTLAVAVIDTQGRLISSDDVPNTERGFAQLTRLLRIHQVVRVGIEGSGGFGRAVAVHLALLTDSADDTDDVTSQNLEVVEVPAVMTSRERRAQLKGKTDPVDALAIARITARETKLPPVRLTVGPAADLRALLDYREDLLHERTALTNRAHADLTGLSPGYQHHVTNLTTRARVRTVLELITHDTSMRADLTRRRLQRVIDIDTEAAALKRQIAALVEYAGSTLTTIHGIGPVVAGRFLAEIVDARRYPTRDTFAAANGTAPIPASSGRTARHRYNPGGNRQLNKALYTIAITQIRADTEGRRYYERKRAQGKTSREALRCLKRRLSDLVYRQMLTDITTTTTTTGTTTSNAGPRQLAPTAPAKQRHAGLAVGAADANEARLTVQGPAA